MIDKNDLRFIHHDLTDLVEKLVEKEEYEKCELAKEYMTHIQNYLAGITEDEDIINPLFDLCFSRYAILRLVTCDGHRYAVFMIPNSSVIFFDVGLDNVESETWLKLQMEYDAVTSDIRTKILSK